MTRRFAVLAGAVLVLAVLGSGCGGGGGDQLTHDQYQTELTTQLAEINAETSAALAAIDSATPATVTSLGDELRTTADSLSDASDHFNSLNPPDDAERANGLLVSALQKVGEGFRQAATSADNGDLEQLRVIKDAYPNSGAQKELVTAVGELKKAGYTGKV